MKILFAYRSITSDLVFKYKRSCPYANLGARELNSPVSNKDDSAQVVVVYLERSHISRGCCIFCNICIKIKLTGFTNKMGLFYYLKLTNADAVTIVQNQSR